MNNQELTKEDLMKQNDFLKIRMEKVSNQLNLAHEYIADLETDLHMAQETLRAIDKAEKEKAQG